MWSRLRWKPWQWRSAGPGMVWVDDKKLIELLQASLRAADLELEIAGMRLARAEDQAAALEQERQLRGAALDVLFLARGRLSPLTMRGLLVDLPTTDDGRLDEVEFTGRVFDATVETAREAETLSRRSQG